MKCVRPWKLAKTYGDQIGCGASDLVVSSVASKSVDGGTAGGDGTNKLADESRQALFILAAAVLVNDGGDLSADVTESVLDLLGRPLGDSAGKGHSTGSKDGEDGGETHDEEV